MNILRNKQRSVDRFVPDEYHQDVFCIQTSKKLKCYQNIDELNQEIGHLVDNFYRFKTTKETYKMSIFKFDCVDPELINNSVITRTGQEVPNIHVVLQRGGIQITGNNNDFANQTINTNPIISNVVLKRNTISFKTRYDINQELKKKDIKTGFLTSRRRKIDLLMERSEIPRILNRV